MSLFLNLTYRQKDSILKWLATIATLAGAICTSLDVNPLNVYLLNAGSLIFLIWAMRIRDNALVVVNAGLVMVYALGSVRSLL